MEEEYLQYISFEDKLAHHLVYRKVFYYSFFNLYYNYEELSNLWNTTEHEICSVTAITQNNIYRYFYFTYDFQIYKVTKKLMSFLTPHALTERK